MLRLCLAVWLCGVAAGGGDDLLKAVKGGDRRAVAAILAREPSAVEFSTEFSGVNPLLMASMLGDSGIVQDLLAAGARTNAADNIGTTPLIAACMQSHTNVIDVLLAAGVDVNRQRKTGHSPLMIAALNDDLRTMRTLVSHGAVVDMTTLAGQTAVFLCVVAKKPPMNALTYLLELGGRPDAADETGLTALEHAVTAYKPDVVKLLVKFGASPARHGKGGITPLHVAANKGSVALLKALLPAVRVAPKDTTEAAVDADGGEQFGDMWELMTGQVGAAGTATEVDVDDIVDDVGLTPLMVAALGDHLGAVRLLLKHGVPVDAANQEGWTALMMAVDGGKPRTAAALIHGGANVDAVNHENVTCLHLAALKQDEDMVDLLLGAGADPSPETTEGYTAAQVALLHSNMPLADKIREAVDAWGLAQKKQRSGGDGRERG